MSQRTGYEGFFMFNRANVPFSSTLLASPHRKHNLPDFVAKHESLCYVWTNEEENERFTLRFSDGVCELNWSETNDTEYVEEPDGAGANSDN